MPNYSPAFDEIVFREIERGGTGTVNELSHRLRGQIYTSLRRLAERKEVQKLGAEGRGNEKIYRVPLVDIERKF